MDPYGGEPRAMGYDLTGNVHAQLKHILGRILSDWDMGAAIHRGGCQVGTQWL